MIAAVVDCQSTRVHLDSLRGTPLCLSLRGLPENIRHEWKICPKMANKWSKIKRSEKKAIWMCLPHFLYMWLSLILGSLFLQSSNIYSIQHFSKSFKAYRCQDHLALPQPIINQNQMPPQTYLQAYLMETVPQLRLPLLSDSSLWQADKN